MCRNIRVLHNFEPPTTPDEVRAAALQYVRKVSGINKPTLADEKTFERAIADVTAATTRLLAALQARGTVRTRDGAGAAAFRLDLAILRCRCRDEVGKEVLRDVCDLVHGAVERRLVRLRRLVHAADLAHVLQRRGVHLLGARGRIEVVENADVPAHAPMLCDGLHGPGRNRTSARSFEGCRSVR